MEEAKKRIIKFYVAADCVPCAEVKELAQKGQFVIDGAPGDLDLVDVETEEGFAQIPDYLDGIPSAYEEGKACAIKIDRENNVLIIECGEHPEGEAKGGDDKGKERIYITQFPPGISGDEPAKPVP